MSILSSSIVLLIVLISVTGYESHEEQDRNCHKDKFVRFTTSRNDFEENKTGDATGNSPPTRNNRIKRNTDERYDLEFSLPIGVSMGLKYKDASRSWRGFKGFLILDDLQKFLPVFSVKKLKLDFDIDNQDLFGETWKSAERVAGYAVEFFDGRSDSGSIQVRRDKSGNISTGNKETWSIWATSGIISNIVQNITLKVVMEPYLSELYNLHHVGKLSFKLDMEGEVCASTQCSDIHFTLKALQEKMGKGMNVDYNGIIFDQKFEGFMKINALSEEVSFQFDMRVNNRPVLQLDVKQKGKSISGKYSVYEGKVARGLLRMKVEDSKNDLIMTIQFKEFVAIKDNPIIIELTGKPTNEGAIIELRNDETLKWVLTLDNATIKDNNQYFQLIGDIKYLGELSKINELLADQQELRTRSTKVAVYIDHHSDSLLPKLNISYEVDEEGSKTVYMLIDTITKPLYLNTNIFRTLEIYSEKIFDKNKREHFTASVKSNTEKVLDLESFQAKEKMTSKLTVYPERNDSTVIDMQFNVPNKKGKNLKLSTIQRNSLLIKYELDNVLENTNTQYNLRLNHSLFINNKFDFLKKMNEDLFNFNTQNAEFDMIVDKNTEHILAKGDVQQDNTVGLNFFLNTKAEPQKFNFFYSCFLDAGDLLGVTVIHKKGQYLEIMTNYPHFKGFRINRIGNGNDREIIWNGKKIGSTDFQGEFDPELAIRYIMNTATELLKSLKVTQIITFVIKYASPFFILFEITQ